MVSSMNPGFVSRKKKQPVGSLYEGVPPEWICPYCEVQRPAKSKHCHCCGRCVNGYDHHCPWINNCVGKNNHKIFIIFIVFISLDCIYNAVIGLMDYMNLLSSDGIKLVKLKEYNKEAALLVSCVSLLSFFVAFPVCFIQVTNFIKKTTTHERFAKRFSPSAVVSDLTSMNSMLLAKSTYGTQPPEDIISHSSFTRLKTNFSSTINSSHSLLIKP